MNNEEDKKEKKLEEEIEELKNKLKEKEEGEDMYLDQLKRLKAEFENYRKRMEKQSVDNFKCGEKKLAHDILVVLDNLQRALDYKDIDFKGLKLITKDFFNILKLRGLKVMESEGKKFDHNFHHAVGFREIDDDTKDGSIIEVLQQGFYWNDEVLRPAMVVVARKKEEK